MAGQDKYVNNTIIYLIKTKTLNYYKALQITDWTKINKTRKFSGLINTVLTDVQCIKIRSHRLLKVDNTS